MAATSRSRYRIHAILKYMNEIVTGLHLANYLFLKACKGNVDLPTRPIKDYNDTWETKYCFNLRK